MSSSAISVSWAGLELGLTLTCLTTTKTPATSFAFDAGDDLVLKLVKRGEPERLVCDKCGYIQYLNPRVASGAIVRSDGKLVLLRRGIEPAYGKWVFPGGFVDAGETP